MDVGKVIFNKINGDSGITAHVKNDTTGTRVFPSAYNVPKGTQAPFIIYHIVSDSPNNTKNGASTYDYVDVQITIFDQSYFDCQDLASKIRTLFDYSSGTTNGVVVDKCFFQGASDAYDDSWGAKGIYQYNMDFKFNINR
jgi:hypothetical protein